MDRSSYFIKDRALFGSFPTQEAVDELEQEGVKYFVNLTYDTEKNIAPYSTHYQYITYPIADRSIPYDMHSYVNFIVYISDIIRHRCGNNTLLYIHCRAGHGRSGVVVASILCHMFNMNPTDALESTTKSHSTRLIMRDKWRKIGAPQTFQQKKFVHNLFEPYYFSSTSELSNFSQHSVTIDGFGTFPTAEAVIQAYKSPNDPAYVETQRNAQSALISRLLSQSITIREDWEKVCNNLILQVITHKFNQHPQLMQMLLQTGLRPLVYKTLTDDFWGVKSNGVGENRLGKALMCLRIRERQSLMKI